ncbi:hypothetical protein [Acinetobacter sp.]|uniref:hypothetical protein n=1 Tax=Acinetobacter sp. TaxID=472 RepID=UPI003C714EED
MDIQRKAFEESNNVNPDWSFKFDEELQQYVAVDFEMTNQVDEFNEHWDTFRAGWDAKAQAVPEGFVVCKSEPVAYIVQNKFWKQKFDVKSVKDMPPQKWEDDHYDVEIPLYAVSLDGLVLKEQDEDEAND